MSIQRVGNGRGSSDRASTAESSLSFLGKDWNKVAQEAAAINEKYNGPKETQPLRVSQSNRGNMYSQKNQHRINFLDGNSVPQPEAKKAQQIDYSALAKKLETRFNPENRLHTSQSVARLSSSDTQVDNTNTISNFGGPSKYMKGQTSPSIWDTDRLARAAQEIADSRQDTRNEKVAQQEYRRSVRQQALDNLTTMLEGVDQRKSSHISTASDQVVPSEAKDQARYERGSRNISIFDPIENQDAFARLGQSSAGERLSQRKAAERSQRDQSWRSGGKSVSTREKVSGLFDMLSNQSREK
jgi:hypothetical protein